MFSERDVRDAMRQLDADFASDHVNAEQYAREEALIQARSSRSTYLKDVSAGLHQRALGGDASAIAKLAFRYALVVVLLLVLLIGGCIASGMEADFGGYVPDGDGD